MCLDPASLAIATFAVTSASTLLEFQGKQQAYKANETAANQGFALQSEQLQQKNVQINAQDAENNLNAVIERAKNSGRISATASALGTSTATATQEQNAANFETGRSASIDQLNASNQRLQVLYDLAGAQQERKNQINSMSKPSVLGLAVKIAGNAAGAAGGYVNAGGKLPTGKAA